MEHRLFKKPLWTFLRGVHPLVILTSFVSMLAMWASWSITKQVNQEEVVKLPESEFCFEQSVSNLY